MAAPALAQAPRPQAPRPEMSPVNPQSPPRVWKPSEMKLSGIPLGGANPFDPDQIAVDVAFTAPSGQAVSIPAFWYRSFSRELKKSDKGEAEALTAQGEGEWRVRWTPLEGGKHSARITVRRKQGAYEESTSTWSVTPRTKGDFRDRGFVRVNPRNRRYFQTQDGQPLPLLGENLCWHGARGTFDYDDWLAGYKSAGMNYARLWMWNVAFGAEFEGSTRQNYNQERLWKLDYVVEKARAQGVNVMLCLDYHGIFQTEPDMWGGNDWWMRHAYQKSTGGPCDKPNDFFTEPAAQVLYRKRLRYLVARYAAFPNLLSWQFFNEINNVYGDAKKTREQNRDALRLNPPDVVAWHERQSKYLRSIDPYRHLLTTSFGSAGEQPEMWKLPSLDYANWHWYGNWSGSGRGRGVLDMAREVGSRFPASYNKPVTIGEFGTDGRSGSSESDPLRRGLRQAIWGGIFSGTAGTAMPWWWEQTHQENLYGLWAGLRQFLPAGFGGDKWAPRSIQTPVSKPELGAPIAGAASFDEKIALVDSWGGQPEGAAIINHAGQGANSTLNGYVQGTGKPEQRAPWRIQANVKAGARLILHLNSVSNDAVLAVRQNGREILRRALPNKDGGYERNNEYDEDIAVPLEAGRADIEVENPGGDWLYLDWARLEGVLPSEVRAGEVPLQAFALGDGASTLLWAVDADYAWPRGRADALRVARAATATLPDLKGGAYRVRWWSPARAQVLGVQTVRAGQAGLKLSLPDFEGDIAAQVSRAR